MIDRNREKFGQIYDQYIEKIYRFVYLKVNSQEVAEDITSKVFLNSWDAYRKDAEDIKNPRAFLYQVARNMVIDHYRDRDRMQIVSTDYIPQIADNRTDLHKRAIIGSDMETVKTAMSKLNQEYQDVLIWRYLEDMPIAEISEILNKPEGTIRVMMHRGLKALRDELTEWA